MGWGNSESVKLSTGEMVYVAAVLVDVLCYANSFGIVHRNIRVMEKLAVLHPPSQFISLI